MSILKVAYLLYGILERKSMNFSKKHEKSAGRFFNRPAQGSLIICEGFYSPVSFYLPTNHIVCNEKNQEVFVPFAIFI